MKKILLVVCILSYLPSSYAQYNLEQSIKQSSAELESLYRDLHQHPELGFQEMGTAALLASKMRGLGFEVTEHVGKTGVVAVYKNGEGPTVMVRTELDALPLEEKTGSPFASKVITKLDGKTTYVAHSCGHDIHMSAWYGSAQILLQNKDKWHGTLVFIAQPNEENLSGARAMIDDGLYSRFPKPDYVFGAHVTNDEVGIVSAAPGYVNSAADNYTITFLGKGGHGSNPSSAIDPIVIGADYVNSIQSIISREKDPDEFGVITVGSFQSGYTANIIPDQAELKLTLRSIKPEIRQLIKQRIQDKAKAIASSHLAKQPLISYNGGAASFYNDEKLTNLLTDAIKADTNLSVKKPLPVASSDDFSEYLRDGVKGVYLSYGGYSKQQLEAYKKNGQSVPHNHSPEFAPDYKLAIPVSIKTIVTSVLAVSQNGTD